MGPPRSRRNASLQISEVTREGRRKQEEEEEETTDNIYRLAYTACQITVHGMVGKYWIKEWCGKMKRRMASVVPFLTTTFG